jgi:hypothetical protein
MKFQWKTLRSLAIAGAAALAFTACQDDLQTVTDETALGGGGSISYDEVIDLDYYPSQGFHMIQVKNTSTGAVDTYYGDDKSWTKLDDNRDAGSGRQPAVAVSVGDNGDFIYAFIEGGTVRVQSGREFSNKPRFKEGQYKIGKDEGLEYDKVIDLDYYPSQGFHMIQVKNTSTGAVDTYYGDDKSWTKLNDNRDAGAAFGAVKAVSVGDNGDFIYAFIEGGTVRVQSGREFFNKPFFDKGRYKIGS